MEILKQYRNTRYYAKEDGTIINKQWNRELVHSVNELGYHRIHPRLKGKRMNLFVHRVVAECFIPNPDNKPFVLHKDNKRISAKGENNGQSKLTDVDVKIIREARAIGFQGRKIAMYYKMSESWIYQICRGERWGHLCA
jgi:hypothetical protein